MKTEVREISPEVASMMLKKNYNNRKLTKSNVTFLSKQMTEGKWLFDGQPIRFDKFGRLLDGQHRLNAVVNSGTTQSFLVVSGLDDSTFQVMDTGKNRSGSDALSIMGVSYANSISACAKLVIKHNKGSHGKTGSHSKITNSDIVEWYNNNREIETKAPKCQILSKAFMNVLSVSYLMYLSLVFDERCVKDSEKFLNEVCHGTNIDSKSPTNVLRKYLISDKLSKKSMSPTNKKALIFKAWNAFRLGKSVSFLRWNSETEKFPNLI